MSLQFDVFWSFRSPYSYVATPGLMKLIREYDVVCNFRPVYPLAVRVEGFFESVHPMWPGYLLNDAPREAERVGLPMSWPDPDPIVQDFTTYKVAKEQPYITRLTRLGAAAARRDLGLEFATAASKRIWGGVKDWDKGDVLAEAATEAGLDLKDLQSDLDNDAAGLDKEIEQNEADQTKAGHWGVPLMEFDGEPFFGQDRIDAMIWRMNQKNLQRR